MEETIMRKSLFIGLVAIFGLIGCSRNQEIDVPDANLSLFARTESPAESRTIVESGVHVYWEPGDEIAVFMGEKSAKFTTDITAASGTATFKGTFGDTTWPEEPDFWAVYPFSEDAAFDGETITTVIPSTQIAREESFAKGANVSIAHSTSANLQFFNVCGGVRFSVEEEGITSIRFESLNHEPIAGKVKISFIDGLPSLKSIEKEDDFIVLNAPDGASFVPGKHYYFTALPAHLSAGYSLSLLRDGQVASKVSNNKVEIKRSIFGKLEHVDNNLEFKDVITPEELNVVTAALSSIIADCKTTNEVDINTQFGLRIDEIRNLPAVDDAFSDDFGAFIRLQNGTIIECPFYTESVFDEEESVPSHSNQIKKQVIRPQKSKGKASIDDAKVVVFNLFSDAPGRTVQNRIVDCTVENFIETFGEDNVYYGCFEDFSYLSLYKAIRSSKCELLYIYSLGSSALSIAGELGDKMMDWLGKTNDDGIAYGQRLAIGGSVYGVSEESFLFVSRGYSGEDYILFDYSSNQMYYSIDLPSFISQLSESSGFPQTEKIIYWGSCYTMSCDVFDRDGWNENTCLLGWTGVNRLAQAYGLVMSEYLIKSGNSLDVFWNDFQDSNGEIIESGFSEDFFDKLEKSKLIKKGKSISSFSSSFLDKPDPVWTVINDSESKFEFVRPDNGACFNSAWKDNYTIDVKLKFVDKQNLSFSAFIELFPHSYLRAKAYGFDFGDAEDFDSDHPFGGNTDKIRTIYKGLSCIGFNIQKVSFNHIQPGVLKLSTAFNSSVDDDVRYVFITKGMGKNDAQFVEPSDVISEPEIVDLGLPSGAKWASFNLGASKPEEYGGYFAWGETKPKVDYSWESYGWCNGNESSLTKYYYGDGKSVLESTDDAAIQLLGGKWRMPSESEWKELIDYCNWTSSSSNGVDGIIAKSKINGAELFFPFSGKIDGTKTMNFGSIGYYWTSSLNPFESLACIGATSPETGYFERYCGLAIRPVYGEANTNTEYATPEAVDLGLPSGVKWASFNLGASKPEEYGDYYAWGEIEPYYSCQDPLTWKEGKESGYYWPSYKWCMGSSYTLTKYCTNSDDGFNGFTDDKAVLDMENDAAHVNLGGTWRMPTDAELNELRGKCTWTWTTLNDVSGRLVTGPNGNSIFIPAAGYWTETYQYHAGSNGFYWSSSLNTDYPGNAWSVFFSSRYVDRGDTYRRKNGFSIRPVCD